MHFILTLITTPELTPSETTIVQQHYSAYATAGTANLGPVPVQEALLYLKLGLTTNLSPIQKEPRVLTRRAIARKWRQPTAHPPRLDPRLRTRGGISDSKISEPNSKINMWGLPSLGPEVTLQILQCVNLHTKHARHEKILIKPVFSKTARSLPSSRRGQRETHTDYTSTPSHSNKWLRRVALRRQHKETSRYAHTFMEHKLSV